MTVNPDWIRQGPLRATEDDELGSCYPAAWDELADLSLEPETRQVELPGRIYAHITVLRPSAQCGIVMLPGVRAGIATKLFGRRALTVLRDDRIEVSFAVFPTAPEHEQAASFATQLGALVAAGGPEPTVRFVDRESAPPR